MNPLETRMRSANPIPDPRSDFDDDEVAALLTLIRARSTDMDMQELTRPVEPEPKRKPSWWIAAAAFAVIIVVVGAMAILLRSGGSDIAPATNPPSTVADPDIPGDAASVGDPEVSPSTAPLVDPDDDATDPPVLDEEAAAAARSIVDAVNSGDDQAVTAIIMSAGTVDSTETPGEDSRVRESGRWASSALLESQAELTGCTTNTSGVTRCEITRSSALDYTSTDPQVTIIEIRMGDGAIAWMRFDATPGAIEQRFFDWIVENHPEDTVPIFVDFSDPQETAGLIRERYSEWLQSGR